MTTLPMRRWRIIVALLVVSVGSAQLPGVAAGVSPTPVGRWYAEGGAAQVEIAPCGEALCGRVVWLRSPFDEHGCGLHDRYNDDPSLRARPIVGLEILRDLRRSERDPRVWERGAIYDPTSGRTYACRLTVLDDGDRLELRGYLGVPLLGRTTTWIRVGAEEHVCQAAAAQAH